MWKSVDKWFTVICRFWMNISGVSHTVGEQKVDNTLLARCKVVHSTRVL